MYIREITLLYICVFVHFRGIESALVIKPQNLAVVSGESVTLHCASDVSAGNIVWSTTDPGSNRITEIYNLNVLDSSFSSYISVSDREDGNCSLNINASLAAAKRYICTEADSGLEASAELIVMKGSLQCNSTNFNGSVHVSCFTESVGNWPPVVECKQWQTDLGLAVLPENQTIAADNNVITRTWNYASENEWFHIFCETTWKESDRNKESSAINIPKYFNPVLAYNGTCVSHGETISSNSSAECPARATACPVAAAAKCPKCRTGATACPVATSAKCPECPTGATACPAATSAKCPECPTGPTACPVATSAKCPEYHAGTTKCPECPTEATKCPECSASVTECPVATSTKCPECLTRSTKCPECSGGSTACPVVATTTCPEYPTGATPSPITFAAASSVLSQKVQRFTETVTLCLVEAASNNSSVTAAAASSVRVCACFRDAFNICRVPAASNKKPVRAVAASYVQAAACFVESVVPCVLAAATNCSVTVAAASSEGAAECLVKTVTPCLVAAAYNCSLIDVVVPAPDTDSMGSAECCLGAGCLALVLLNCVVVLAGTGLGDAGWKCNNDTQNKTFETTGSSDKDSQDRVAAAVEGRMDRVADAVGDRMDRVAAAVGDRVAAAVEGRTDRVADAVGGRVATAVGDRVAAAAEDRMDRVADAVGGRSAAAVGDRVAADAEGRVGSGWIASVVLNCVSVPVLIGLAFAVYKGKSSKKPEDKKPKPREQGTALNDADQASQDS